MKTKLRQRYNKEKEKNYIPFYINKESLYFFVEKLFLDKNDQIIINSKINNANGINNVIKDVLLNLYLDYKTKYKITIYKNGSFSICSPSQSQPASEPQYATEFEPITKPISLTLKEISYKKKYFDKLNNHLNILINKKNILPEETIYENQKALLELSRFIPFNSYDYCSDIITNEYYLYKYEEMLKHREKIILYVIDKINNKLQEYPIIESKLIYKPLYSIDELIKIRSQELNKVRLSS